MASMTNVMLTKLIGTITWPADSNPAGSFRFLWLGQCAASFYGAVATGILGGAVFHVNNNGPSGEHSGD